MIFVTVECNCDPEQEYVDGSKPSFYTEEKKAAYMFAKCKNRAEAGILRIQAELIILPNGDTKQGLPPLPNLKDYNLYFGVHLNGQHVLSVHG